MGTLYPAAIDSSINLPPAIDNVTATNASVVNALRDAIIAIEATLGVAPQSVYTTVRNRLDYLESIIGQGGSGPAGGNLSGTYPNPIVIAINGVIVSGTPSVGQTIVATSSSTASWQTSGGGSSAVGFEGTTNIQSLRSVNQLTTDNTKTGETNFGSDTTGSLPYLSGNYATCGGGDQNDVIADYATCGGGTQNIVNGQGASCQGGTGNMASGNNSGIEGDTNSAFGNNSHAEGQNNSASGNQSHAEGFGCQAGYAPVTFTCTAGGTVLTMSGNVTANFLTYGLVTIFPQTPNIGPAGAGSIASGPTYDGGSNQTTISLDSSFDAVTTGGLVATNSNAISAHAEGFQTQAIGSYSHAEGQQTQALMSTDHAEGSNTIAGGGSSHAEGYSCYALGENSHAEGLGAISGGLDSHAEGENTYASGEASHAEGVDTIAMGYLSHAEGGSTHASSSGSHAEGAGTIAGQPIQSFTITPGDVTVTITGIDVTAQFVNGDMLSIQPLAPAKAASVQKRLNVGPTFSGGNTTFNIDSPIDSVTSYGYISDITSFQSSHAEGSETQASGSYSHAEGENTVASGEASHAEGSVSVASGFAAHAEGTSIASGAYSHSEGVSSTAIRQGQHSQCSGNAPDVIHQTSVITMSGTTPGSGANETVSLQTGPIGAGALANFTLEDGKAYIVNVDVIADVIISAVHKTRALTLKAAVRRDSGTVSVLGTNTGESFGDAALSTSTLTITASGGDLLVTFGTGSGVTGQATVAARVVFTEVS